MRSIQRVWAISIIIITFGMEAYAVIAKLWEVELGFGSSRTWLDSVGTI